MHELLLTRREFLGLGALTAVEVLLDQWKGARHGSLKIGVAVLGLGTRGTTWAANLAHLPGVRVVGVADPDPRAIAASRSAWPGSVPGPAGSREDMEVLRDPAVHVVWVSAPPARAIALACAACEQGKDVYLDAPLAMDVHALHVLLRTGRETGRLVQHGISACSNPAALRAIGACRSGRLGTLSRATIQCTVVGVPGDVTPPDTLLEELQIAISALGVTRPTELRSATGASLDPATGQPVQNVLMWCRFQEGPVMEIALGFRPVGSPGERNTVSTWVELSGSRGRMSFGGSGTTSSSRYAAGDRATHAENFLQATRLGDNGFLRAPLEQGALSYLMLWNAKLAASEAV